VAAREWVFEMTDREFHPLADIFPLLDEKELDELAADIRAHGLRVSICLYSHEGKILDGRNRYLACKRAGVEPRFHTYYGPNPLGYVISANLHRRHLDASQRAMVAAKIATLQDGQRQVGKFADVPTQAQAAKRLNVSERIVRSAREVIDKGVPELVTAVERGEISASTAAYVARTPEEKQREIIAADECTFEAFVRQVRAEKSQAVVHDLAGVQTVAQQKADKYFAEQEARLGPIAPITRKQHIADGITSLRSASASFVKAEIHDFTSEITSLIERGLQRMKNTNSD